MKVTINGEEFNFDKTISVGELIEELRLDTAQIAVEQNLAIVPLSTYNDTQIVEGDKIEIVQFMGGG